MADKQLRVIISAKSALAEGFSHASAQVRSLGERLANATGGSADATLKLLGNVAKTNVALAVGASVVKAMYGDWQGVDETLQRLPVGLGEVYRLEKEILGYVTGHNARMAELAERQKQMESDLAANREIMSRTIALREITEQYRQQIELLQAEPGARRQAVQISQQFARELEKINDLYSKGGLTVKDYEDAIRRLQEADKLRVGEVQRAEQERQQKVAEEAAKAREAEQEAQKAHARELATLDAQIRAERLRAAGQDLEAQLVLLRDNYAKRIEAAKDAAERQRLVQLQALEEERLKRGATGSESGFRSVTGASLSSGFRGLAERAQSESVLVDVNRRQLAKLDEIAKLQKDPPWVRNLPQFNGIALGMN